MPTTCGANPPRPRGGRLKASGVPGGAPSDQLSRTPRGPTARPFHKQEPLRARPAKLRVPRLLAAPRYRNGCAVLLGRAWLRSAVATERSNERGVAAQRFAQARGAVKNKIQAAPVLRTDAWRRSVGQPLLRDNPALGSQTFTRNADPRLFKQGGAAGQQSAARARCRMVAQDSERGAAPREPIASAIPVREGQRETQAPAQGDVHVRRGQRGARVSRHRRKPSPRTRARLRAETSAVARPHVWQKLGLAKMGVECARRDKLPTMRPISLNNFQNSSCLSWMSLLVVGPRAMFNLDHVPCRLQQKNMSLDFVMACLARLSPYWDSRSS